MGRLFRLVSLVLSPVWVSKGCGRRVVDVNDSSLVFSGDPGGTSISQVTRRPQDSSNSSQGISGHSSLKTTFPSDPVRLHTPSDGRGRWVTTSGPRDLLPSCRAESVLGPRVGQDWDTCPTLRDTEGRIAHSYQSRTPKPTRVVGRTVYRSRLKYNKV